MDSILNFEINRIYRIVWIFYIPGFQKKPGIRNPLRGKKSSSSCKSCQKKIIKWNPFLNENQET